MYRILDGHAEVRERRDQLRHPVYSKPELLAEGPDQVWSWDITKLMGPVKWSCFYLYVIRDTPAAGSSAGVSRTPKARPCSRSCSMTPSPSMPCRPVN